MSASAPERNTLLFLVDEYAEFIELRRLARAGRTRCGWEVLFLFLRRSYRSLGEHTSQLVGDGFKWIDHEGALHDYPHPGPDPRVGESNDVRVGSGNRIGVSREGGAFKATAVDIVNFLHDLRHYRPRSRRYRALVNHLRPCCVVAAQDFVGSAISLVLIAARRERIPSIIVPYAMFNLDEARNYSLSRPNHQLNRPFNRLLLLGSRRWLMSFGDVPLCRLPASRALALDLLGLAPEMPWVPCDGAASVMALASDAARDSMRGMGLAEDRLEVTGAMVHDRLQLVRKERDTRRRTLLERTGQSAECPLVLCAWPPVQTVHEAADREFQSYAKLTTAWAATLSRLRDRGCAVVVKPHPKATAGELDAARACGLAIADDDTADLVPLCDVFATTSSSVTSWAIALGIPVADYDCYRFGYNDFADESGVLSSTSMAAFSADLERLVFDTTYHAEVACRQRRRARYWGNIDGNAGTRLVALIENLTRTGMAGAWQLRPTASAKMLSKYRAD